MKSRPFQVFMGSLLALPLALSLACGGGGSSYTPPDASPSTDVYVAGSADLKTDTGFNHVAVIWKNGIPVNLTDGMQDAEANAAIVSGTTLYVVGYENNGTADVARVWTCDTAKPFVFKSFTATAMTDGTSDARAEHLLVSGTNLYVSGNEAKDGVDVAKIWRHDVAAPFADQSFASAALTAGVYGAAAYAMTADDRTLYVAGYAGDDTNDLATLWTYDVTKAFAQDAFVGMSIYPGTDAYANDVKVSNGTLWIAGSTYPTVNPVAMVWSQDLNGLALGTPFLATALNFGTSGSEAFAVTESAGTVYIAGYEANATARQAKIWSMPVTSASFRVTTLTNSSYDAEAADLAVVGSLVYAVGYDAQPLVAPPPASPNTKAMSLPRTLLITGLSKG